MLQKLKSKIWIIAGATALLCGILGTCLPVLPTTPFVLLAAFCFTKGSTKALQWLENNKFFGQILRDYRAGLGVPLSTKITSITTLWITMTLSIIVTQILWLSIILVCIGIAVTIHICHLKTRHPKAETEYPEEPNKFLTNLDNPLKRPAARCDGRTD